MPLLKRSVTGPGETIANGIGAINAKRKTAKRNKSGGFERYLGIGCCVIAETILETLEFGH